MKWQIYEFAVKENIPPSVHGSHHISSHINAKMSPQSFMHLLFNRTNAPTAPQQSQYPQPSSPHLPVPSDRRSHTSNKPVRNLLHSLLYKTSSATCHEATPTLSLKWAWLIDAVRSFMAINSERTMESPSDVRVGCGSEV